MSSITISVAALIASAFIGWSHLPRKMRTNENNRSRLYQRGGRASFGGERPGAVIREQGRDWQVRLVNLFEVLDPQDVFRKTTGMKPEHYYNARLARGWTLGSRRNCSVLQALIRLSHKSLISQLRRHWRETQPDLVVSLVPNFNRAMYQALAAARPTCPYVTILTDFADLPPHFWIEPHQAQHWICGTAKAVAQARAAGYDEAHIHATSGMIIQSGFLPGLEPRPARGDAETELDPDRPTGMVMFGGHGSRVMRGIAKRLDDTQLILVCGHNSALADEAARHALRAAPRVVIGFTAQMRYFMQLSDFFIGKPGPGSISEAVAAAAAGHRGAQRLDHAAGALQRRVGRGERRREWCWIHSGTFARACAQVTDRLDAYRAQHRSASTIARYSKFRTSCERESSLRAPARVGVDFVQHFRAAQRLHLS